MWAAGAIAPAGMHIQCIALRYNKPSKLENHKASYLLRFFNKTCASVLFLEFRYFELRNIYKRILSPLRIQIFSSELASSFIDSGAGLVLSSYMVRFSHSIEQRKQIYSCKANSLGVVWCSYNEPKNRLCVYRRLLTNRLHGKAAELYS